MNAQVKPRHFNTANSNKKHFVSSAERRYRSAMFKIRGMGRGTVSKETQQDIAHLMNDIERFGFSFFPNHYVMDSVERLKASSMF